MSIDFEWTPVRRKFLEACLERKLEPVFIATAISNVLRVPCDIGVVEAEAFRIALEVIDGLNNKNQEIPHSALSAVTPGSGTVIRPVLPDAQKYPQGLDGDGIHGFKAPEAASVPEVVETPPSAPLTQEEKIARGRALAEAKKSEKPKQPQKLINEIRICAHAPCGKEFTQTYKGKTQLYCSLRCNKAATRDRARMKAEAEKASATQDVVASDVHVFESVKPQPEILPAFEWTDEIVAKPDEAVPIEPSLLDATLKLNEPVASFTPMESRNVVVPTMPKPSQIPPRLIGQVVLPIQGDPPPGRSAYDRMLRGEK